MTEYYSDIPLWTLILWVGFVVAISLFYYRKKSWIKEISKGKRILLISLRSIGLFLLGILLIGILIKGIDKEIRKPFIITLVDNSQSMLNYADSAQVEGQTKAFLKATNTQFSSDYTPLTFTLHEGLEDIDSLTFDEKRTNLSQALDKIYNKYYGRNIGAVIMLSDGNFNAGTTPLIIADKFKRTPVYTLGVGDTIQKVDHLIKSVTTNEIAFLGNKFPVEVTVEGNLTPNTKFKIQLLEDGKELDSRILTHQDNTYSLIKTKFYLDAKKVGIHEYTVRVESLANEFNLNNNVKSFYVEVLDDRSKVLMVSESLNPDMGQIKLSLASEKNIEVTTAPNTKLPKSIDDFDLLIWYNPGASKNQAAFQRLLSAEKPKWYIITPQTSSSDISKLQLGGAISKNNQSDNVNAAFNQAFNLFQLDSETRKAIDNFPPLKVPYGSIKYGDLSSILAYQKIGKVVKREPIFYFFKNQELKSAVTYGTGIWSWSLADYQQNKTHDHFNEIIRKTVEYLILKENTSRLRVNLPSVESNDEDLIIRASFYNDSYEPITDPIIDFQIKKKDGESYKYAFLPLDKDYSLNLGKLTAGRYSWKASTTFNKKDYVKEGTFAVKDLSIEKQTTKANHQLLQQMAENGNGKFALLSDYQSITKDINQRNDIAPIAYEKSAYHNLIDYIWLLVVIIAVFTTEWFIRRYSGAY